MSFVNSTKTKPQKNVNYFDIEAEQMVPINKSKIVYDHKPTGFRLFGNLAAASYETVDTRDDFLDDRYLNDYHIDTDLSYTNEESLVVYNNDTRRVVIIFRGTDPTNVKDLYDDLHITIGTFGLFDTRFKGSLELARKVISEYSGYTVIISGHSLGAYIAYHVSKEISRESYNFALPGSMWHVLPKTRSFNWLLSFYGPEYLDKHIYTTRFDPIGMMGYMSHMKGDKQIVPMKSGYYFNPHSVEHYT